MRLRRLFPDHAIVAGERALDGLAPGALAPPERPVVLANMVVSVDGRAAVGGGSRALTVRADRVVFHGLRAQVDAVLAGTVTLRAEHYGRLVRDPERRAQREARGLAADPLAVVLSRSGKIPDVPLLSDPEQPVVVLTGDEAEPVAALRRLRAEHGVRALLCEGGPTLLRGLLDAGVVDELFVTVSPLLAGGQPPFALLAGAELDPAPALELVWVLEADGALFLRYRIVRGLPS